MADDLIEAEVDAVVPAETDAAAPAEQAASIPAPDWSSPEAQAQIDQRVQATIEQMAAQAQYQQQPEEPQGFELDPFDPNYQQNLQQMIRHEAQQMVQEQMGQYQPAIQHSQEQWAEQWTNTALDRIGVTNEQERTQIVYATPTFLQQTGDPQQALKMAADFVRSQNEQLRAAAIEEYKATLAQPGTTAGPNGGAGAGLEVQEPSRSYEDVVANWTSGMNV